MTIPRAIPLETVTNVPVLTGFITSHQLDQTCVMSQDVLKSGGTPPHPKTYPPFRAQNSRLRLGVRRCSAALGSSGSLPACAPRKDDRDVRVFNVKLH